MEDLLISQGTLIDAIRKLGVNFSKDGAERKSTKDYFNRKLVALENYWKEFESNHVELSRYDIRDEEYHINGDYVRTMALYKNLKESIIEQQEKHSLRVKGVMVTPQPTTSKQQDSGDYTSQEEHTTQKITGQQSGGESSSFQEHISRGVSSKLDDMLRKQYVNFKAFSRTVAGLDLSDINEKWEFDDALRNLESRWSVIDTLHWEIEAELNGEDPPYQGVFFMHEETFCNWKKQINKKMWAVHHREKSTPIMDTPSFDGKFNQWTSFKDLFYESVHNNPCLSNAQKMQFLKSKLKGEAEGLVRHLPVSSNNYEVCWEILNNRYDNKKRIFTSHINLLLSSPNIQQQSVGHIKKLHDLTLENLHAIKNLGIDISTWDPLLVHLISQKLDSDTHADYIESLKNPRELPVLQDFIDFLEAKFTTLESTYRKQEQHISKTIIPRVNANNGKFKNYNNQKPIYAPNNNYMNQKSSWKSAPQALSGYGIKCLLCKHTDHLLYQCKEFIGMPHDLKLKTVNQLNICKNCLFDHNGKNCFSTKRCRNCKCKHHTLLHDACQQAVMSTSASESAKHVPGMTHVSQNEDSQVLLATALVRVTAANGVKHTMRALIDQGSQISLITENAAQILGIKRRWCSGAVFGVGEKQNNSKGVIKIECSSIHNDFFFNTDALIMNSLIKNLPTQSFSKPKWSHISGIQLADPEFNINRRVDLLFGAEIYSQIMLSGILRGECNSQPIAQQTQLGWILCGNVMTTFQCNVVVNNIEDIKKFWEVEDIDNDTDMSSEDLECIQFYRATTMRHASGRFIVRLPIKGDQIHTLGSSKNIAMAQFYNLEKRLNKQNQLAEQYRVFMADYRALGHMRECSHLEELARACYLPHHCVQGQTNVGKFRVVFNASSRTSTGVSLNDIMLRGPNLQKDLQSLILNWRQFQFVVTADIEKMYRQILIHEADQVLQRILWRDTSDETVQSYQLTTLTYGLKAAPFLAMMTLKKLAEDNRTGFPEAARILEHNFFMDDLLTGFHSISEGQILIANLNELLQSGGFVLRKWASNNRALLENLQDKQKRENDQFHFKLDNTKTLGLSWNIKEDKFTFQHQLTDTPGPTLTKRVLLSEISKIFDPLGWLAPVVTNLKLLFQNVWKANMEWDNPLSNNITAEWTKLRADIHNIQHCELPRWIGSGKDDYIQLHGFCDASMKAYACVVYARIQQPNKTTITLVAAKNKLVPLGKQLTLPKLELSGAQLLAKLVAKILHTLPEYNTEVFGWCDSKVVLGWLQGDPGRWKPFISNRVKIIKTVMPTHCWRYVKSVENPADCASRGQLASQLRENRLWWGGPTWLMSFDRKKKQEIFVTEVEKRANQITNATQIEPATPSIIIELLHKHSSLKNIVAIVAWILRAFQLNRKQSPSYLTLPELRKAKTLIIKHTQAQKFDDEFKYLHKHNTVKSNSKLLNLNPFIDKDGVLRVGGRLGKSNLKLETKHPIILPYDSRLTTLLIEEAHKDTFHGGARLTITRLRQRYWIVGGIRAVKKQLRTCVICRKHNPQYQHQLMGTLPEPRTTEAPPFYHTGVDLTGFVDVKANHGRGIKTTKGYIVLFICMVTKAVHIELASDLSSRAFLSALKRMAARRGAPHHLYSDNGTNFIKSNRNLQEEYFDLQNIIDKDFLREVTDMKIEWHFQAPSWPSASGLWERGIRSLKGHLKPVIGEQKLTFEEYSTLLAQVEACLNSRPLCALTEDPDDLDVLTPAHFLNCRADLTVIETERDARTRWQLVRKLLEDVWKRWKLEYLTQLTVRSKWFKQQRNISIGDIVCIHEDHLPPGKWSMGRVVELHPGSDGVVRVVTLKTKNGLMKRPVLKLSVLPIRNDDSAEVPSAKITTSSAVTSSKKHRRNSIITTLFSIILFMNICTGGQSELHVNRFNHNQSLYLDKISNLQVARDEWKLVVYYEMDPFWQGCSALNKYVKQIEQTCSKLNETSYCDVISSQLRHGYSELQYYNQVLQTQHYNARPRRRRGLVNGVGYLSNYLFGVLDERFAEQYQQDITQIRDNQRHLANLWKNQTSIVEAEYNLLKRTEDSISKQHESIHGNILKLSRALNDVTSEINVDRLNNYFTLGALTASNLLNNLRGIQGMLLDQVTDIYHGKFNFHLVTPEQLLRELSVISTQLPSDLSLPIENVHNDIHKIYSLLRIKTRMLQKYLMFEIRIPLTNRDKYELYRLMAIPQRMENNLMISIVVKSEYVAINLRKDTFLPITEHQISECLQQESDTLICYIQTPIHQLRGDHDLCESTDEARTCRLVTAPCNNKWVNLHNINTYLYVCCHECTVRAHCGMDRVTSYQLPRAGIAALSSDCMLKTDDSVIFSHKLLRPDVIHIRPEVIVTSMPPINQLINLSIPLLDMKDHDAQNRTLELGIIHDNIQRMKEQADLSMSGHDIHHYVAIYCLLALVGIAGAIFTWRRMSRRWRVSQREPATERSSSTSRDVGQNEGCRSTSESGNIKCISVQRCNSDSESEIKMSQLCKQDRGTMPDLRKPVFCVSDNV